MAGGAVHLQAVWSGGRGGRWEERESGVKGGREWLVVRREGVASERGAGRRS